MKAKMVTRTVQTTEIVTVGINILTPDKVEERVYKLEGSLSKEQALKAAKKHSEHSSYTPAMVKDLTVTEKVLGIPMDVFLEHAIEVERPESQRK